MGFGGGSRLGGQMADINVTPMVDVMLVLLVIFMVTAPMLQRGVSVELPRAKAGSIAYDERQLMLTISAAGQIRLQDQAYTLAQLEEKLTALHKDNPEAEIYLSADRKVQYELVVQTIAAVRAAGITRLGMVTDPVQDEK